MPFDHFTYFTPFTSPSLWQPSNLSFAALSLVFCLFACCFLDSTYNWDYTNSVFLHLTYLTEHNAFKIHLCCCNIMQLLKTTFIVLKKFLTELSLSWLNNIQLYAYMHIFLTENKEELRASWWKWKESEKVGLKLNIQKTKIMAPGPISSVQLSSVAQSCLTLCNPMNLSMPGLPVYHQLLEFTQTHVHWVGNAI